jgi:hypothetical protein
MVDINQPIKIPPSKKDEHLTMRSFTWTVSALLLAPAYSAGVTKHDTKEIISKTESYALKREVPVKKSSSPADGDAGVAIYAVVYGDYTCLKGNETMAILYDGPSLYGPTGTCIYDESSGNNAYSFICDATSVYMNSYDISDTTCSNDPLTTYEMYELTDYASDCMGNTVMYCAVKDAVAESKVDATITMYDYTYDDDFGSDIVDPTYKCTEGTTITAIEGAYQSFYACEESGTQESSTRINVCTDPSDTFGMAFYPNTADCSGTQDYTEFSGGCTQESIVYECV